MKSPLYYVGGKFYIKDWIISFFDYSKDCYIELFGGGGHILLAKPPHKIEIFNDNDKLLINLFKIIREKGEKLAEELEKIPYSREIFNEFKKSDWDKLDDFEKAVRWYYILKNSFSGSLRSWSYGFIKNNAKAYFNSLYLLKEMKKRIKNVQIECKDYKDIIKSITKEKQKNIMIYADPPYINANYYNTSWTLEDHKEFAEIMNNLDCSIAISYYKTKEIIEWYPKNKWHYNYKKTKKHSYGITKDAKQNTKPNATELLLTNYETQKQLWYS